MGTRVSLMPPYQTVVERQALGSPLRAPGAEPPHSAISLCRAQGQDRNVSQDNVGAGSRQLPSCYVHL